TGAWAPITYYLDKNNNQQYDVGIDTQLTGSNTGQLSSGSTIVIFAVWHVPANDPDHVVTFRLGARSVFDPAAVEGFQEKSVKVTVTRPKLDLFLHSGSTPNTQDTASTDTVAFARAPMDLNPPLQTATI